MVGDYEVAHNSDHWTDLVIKVINEGYYLLGCDTVYRLHGVISQKIEPFIVTVVRAFGFHKMLTRL
jgi:hypothetical protein